MKAIGYIRVSTEGQATEGVSLDAQEAKIRAWAELNGAESVSLFVDAGLSGKRADNRPALQDALRNVQKGDALVVYSLSRLSRSTKDTIALAEALEKRGADLVSLSEKIDTTTAAGKMVFRMLAVLSEFERDQVSERTKTALAHKRSLGEKTGGDVPFGYRLEGDQLVPEPVEQEAIEFIKVLRSKGYSSRQISAELEVKGYRTRRGNSQWDHKLVLRIMERERIAA